MAMPRMNWMTKSLPLIALLFLPAAALGESPASVMLSDIDSGLTSPQGHYRWMDVADQLYATTYNDTYDYTAATVQVDYFTDATTLHGALTAANLKPNFAYQFKLAGDPGVDPVGNERVGLTGRWWQEQWDNGAGAWTNGQNLNDKGTGASPNPNDVTYFARRDIADSNSPTGRKYRYTSYRVLDYFITDAQGAASLSFAADSSYHVLWKTSQHARSSQDGPLLSTTFEVTLPDPVGAYDAAQAKTTVEIFGEWERLPVGGIGLDVGSYEVEFFLTEESFHGSGLAGGWAAAMGATATFIITPEPATLSLLALGGLALIRRRPKTN